MTLKIMSGIVLPLKQKGSVEIMFADHTTQNSYNANTIEKKTVGPAGNFKKIPSKIVALRQIKVQTVVTPSGGPSFLEKFKIGDYVNKQRLKITWSAGDNSEIEEISYMVIGEV